MTPQNHFIRRSASILIAFGLLAVTGIAALFLPASVILTAYAFLVTVSVARPFAITNRMSAFGIDNSMRSGSACNLRGIE